MPAPGPAPDADAPLQVLEIDHEAQPGLGQVGADGLVALPQPLHAAGEALDGPAPPAGPADLVDVGGVARVRQGEAEGRQRGLALAEVRILEAEMGALNRLDIIRRLRPVHGRPFTKLSPVRAHWGLGRDASSRGYPPKGPVATLFLRGAAATRRVAPWACPAPRPAACTTPAPD